MYCKDKSNLARHFCTANFVLCAMQFSHLYSVEEAQAKLREIMPTLEEMMRLKHECDRRGYDVYRHQYFGGMGPNGQKEFPPEMEDLAELASRSEERRVGKECRSR